MSLLSSCAPSWRPGRGWLVQFDAEIDAVSAIGVDARFGEKFVDVVKRFAADAARLVKFREADGDRILENVVVIFHVQSPLM